MTKEAGLAIRKNCGYSHHQWDHGAKAQETVLLRLMCQIVPMLLLWNHINGSTAWERKGGKHSS